MKINFFSSLEKKSRFGWADIVIIVVFFSILYAVIKLGAGMAIPFSAQHPQADLNMSPWLLPYYAGRSLLRMFLAFGASLLFTFIYGRIAAYHRTAEKFMIPAIDILQSVPVLGFLSATVLAFMALFPGSLLGVECAAIFAIFTGQVWNMTFSFYNSLSTIPRELREAAAIQRLGPWKRFTKLELPYSMLGLIWNSMMSFGGGWFFLAASESISVLNQSIHLPGIGSYMATAIDQGHMKDIIFSIMTMIVMIVGVDQLFWRPIVAWAQKFKNEQTEASEVPTSWVLFLLRRAGFLQTFLDRVSSVIHDSFIRLYRTNKKVKVLKKPTGVAKLLKGVIGAAAVALILYYLYEGILEIIKLPSRDLFEALLLGIFTAIRVFIATLLGLVWTLPVGVLIGIHPKLSRIAQPIVQILASFPANMVFPFLTVFYLQAGIGLNIGSVPLMMLGTQWYILFNVIAGAMAIPSDLKEAASILRLTRFQTWKKLILPGIFPFLVTGAITASGGAWNASIVSEIVSWKNNTLQAQGLGAYIAQATTNGDWPRIVWGIMVMALLVVLVNRLFWRRLYAVAERKYHL